MTEQQDIQERADDGVNKWAALFVVVIGTFMVMLDSSIVNIALPKMMNVFGSDLEAAKWILTGYTLAMGAVIPITGFLSDTFGIKKLFIVALSIFTLGSFLCGLAWSNTAMVVFRIIQAVGGGAIMPVGMAYIFSIFPVSERGKALGFWGIASMSAPAIGPTLGGYIIQYMDWRFIFYVNVPIGVVGIFFAGILLTKTSLKPYQGNFDFIGFFSSVIAIVSLLYVLGEGNSIDWGNIQFPLILALGCGSLLIFIVTELGHPEPLLDLRLFKNYDFTLSQIITSITMMAIMSGIYMLPLFLQNLRGYTAMQTGLILLPSALSSAFMMPISGALFDKFGAKVVTIPGLLIIAITTYQMSKFNMDTTVATITVVSTIRGIGLGFSMMPVATAGMNAIPRHLAGGATALSSTLRSIVQALAITFITSVISTKSVINYARFTEQITPFNHTASNISNVMQGAFMKSGLSQGNAHGSALSTLGRMLYAQAYLDAINYAIAVTVPAALAGVIFVIMMSSKKTTKKRELEKSLVKEKVLHESETKFAGFVE
ncbi:MAG TPA: DHA2 family efflux MFS transporter permease subunit [Desulfosporosinus sp.]|nr:DHA2 family efflux MFS transporter permease subunit [Desulfosporosinus sp.]